MWKLHEIREIIKLIDQTGVTEIQLEEEGSKLSIKKGGDVVSYVAAPAPVAAAPVQAAAASDVDVNDPSLHKITSPMVGTFYKAPEPGAAPYVSAGDKVEENTIVCIVEAMKLFNEIEAEVKGEIVKVLVEDGQLVEYGQPLFLVKAE
jgi:acetyl-CoA carboxylase biotin carboxyl carrier protein